MRVYLWFRANLAYWFATRRRAGLFLGTCLLAYGVGLLLGALYFIPSSGLIFKVHSLDELRMVLIVVFHLGP